MLNCSGDESVLMNAFPVPFRFMAITLLSGMLVAIGILNLRDRTFWTDPTDGNLYVFVVMTKDTMDRALASAAQAQIKKEIAQGEKSLDKALDKLDAAIAAREKQS